MSRFVLASVAIHLGVLAALSYSAARSQLLPSALTVTLEKTTADSAPSHPTIAPGPAAVVAANTSHQAPRPPAPPMSSQVTARQTEQNIAVMPQAQDLETNDQAGLDSTDPLPRQKQKPVIVRRDLKPPPTQIDSEVLTSRLQGQLRNALAAYFSYPLLARRNGWQGRVQVGLRVEANGRLSHVRITHSSGYRLLDNAALTTLNQVTLLPKAIGWLGGRHFDMVLPIEYRLIDGQS